MITPHVISTIEKRKSYATPATKPTVRLSDLFPHDAQYIITLQRTIWISLSKIDFSFRIKSAPINWLAYDYCYDVGSH